MTGAAALVKQAHPDWSARQIKAALMNQAETGIMNKPAHFGGAFTITRIGSGEVRVLPALTTPAIAWDVASQSGSLSFGFQDVTQTAGVVVITRTVNVRNDAPHPLTYQISPEFRLPTTAENSGTVHLAMPESIVVPAQGNNQFVVTMTIDGHLLRDWQLNSGPAGGNGNLLSVFEYDGYIRLTEVGNSSNTLHLAWQVLPRKAGDITLKAANASVELRNRGVATTTVESFSLIADSANLPEGSTGKQNPIRTFIIWAMPPILYPLVSVATQLLLCWLLPLILGSGRPMPTPPPVLKFGWIRIATTTMIIKSSTVTAVLAT